VFQLETSKVVTDEQLIKASFILVTSATSHPETSIVAKDPQFLKTLNIEVKEERFQFVTPVDPREVRLEHEKNILLISSTLVITHEETSIVANPLHP
tara:strand:- start:469 stop:759 length:291 start_codon:yes stop_codon:yes gene_type:complete